MDKNHLLFSNKYDIILASTGETPQDISKSYCLLTDNVAIGNDIILIKTSINSIFLTYYLNFLKNEIAKLAQGVSVYHLKINDLKKLKLKIPSEIQQTNICNFLLLFEKKIELLKRKQEIYEKIKKYYLINLYPVNNIPHLSYQNSIWKNIKLSDYGITHNGLTGKTTKDFGKGKKYLKYKAILNKEYADMNQISYVKIKDEERQYRLKDNDIIFNISSETPYEVALASLIPESIDECYLNSFCYAYTINDKNIIDPLFLVYYFRSPIMRHKLAILSQGSTRYNLSKNEVLNMTIPITDITSQKKIVSIIKCIDDKISLNKYIMDYIVQFQNQMLYMLLY